MKKFRTRKKTGIIFSIIGIILMVASITTVGWWEVKGRKQFLYSEVVVLNQSVEAETIITEDMIKYFKEDPGNFIEGAVVDKNDVIGKRAAHFIPKYSQLALAFFVDESVKAAEEGKYIFAIPKDDWIITFPNSLRRGDTIFFYPVKMLEESKEEEGINNYSNPISSTKIYKEENMINCEVAHLKDSGNREVVTVAGEERDDGSSNIATIEIITNYEDISYLQGLVEDSWKFIILYKD